MSTSACTAKGRPAEVSDKPCLGHGLEPCPSRRFVAHHLARRCPECSVKHFAWLKRVNPARYRKGIHAGEGAKAAAPQHRARVRTGAKVVFQAMTRAEWSID